MPTSLADPAVRPKRREVRRQLPAAATPAPHRPRVFVLFGTRPEVIKLAPVLHALQRCPELDIVTASSSQHVELLRPLLQLFDVDVQYDLRVMQPGQTLNQVCARILRRLDPVLAAVKPEVVVVQGDTTTAWAGALAAFQRRIPVAHVEAGLRTHDLNNPFPEEMNRRLITQVATWHFAATEGNRQNLLNEGIAADRIFVTGNPVVDALQRLRSQRLTSPRVRQIVERTQGLKSIVLTTHRRESFGRKMAENLRVLRRFVEEHPDVALLFPVHPNPVVQELAHAHLANHRRIELLVPLDYLEFIGLLEQAWLIVSDSGGIQEEAPSLGKPLLILRAETERPEAVASGVARLVPDAATLGDELERCHRDGPWLRNRIPQPNPFGQGDASTRIANALTQALKVAMHGG